MNIDNLLDRVTEIDLDEILDPDRGILYLGRAWKTDDGRWECIASVGNMLCRVEVKITMGTSKSG